MRWLPKSDGRAPEAVHGALLTVAELLGAGGASLSDDQLSTLFEHTWATFDHRDKTVRRAVLDVPPRLAAHCDAVQSTLFVDRYLYRSVKLVSTSVRRAAPQPESRCTARSPARVLALAAPPGAFANANLAQAADIARRCSAYVDANLA